MVVMSPESTSSGKGGAFLERRLYGFGYITTSRSPSSFDSSDSSSSGSSFEPFKSLDSSFASSELQVIAPKIGHGLSSSLAPLTVSLLIQILFAVLYFRVVTDPIISAGKLDERMENVPASGDDFS